MGTGTELVLMTLSIQTIRLCPLPKVALTSVRVQTFHPLYLPPSQLETINLRSVSSYLFKRPNHL